MCSPSDGAALRTRSGVRESLAAGPVSGNAADVGRLEHVARQHGGLARGLGEGLHLGGGHVRADQLGEGFGDVAFARPGGDQRRSRPARFASRSSVVA